MITFTEQFPCSIQIGGKDYAINTDYRIMAKFETKINRIDTSDWYAFKRILEETISALFIDIPQASSIEIFQSILWYYRCGEEPRAERSGKTKQYYDYDEDSAYIFAAFMQMYGDDLINSHMHWWEFRSKFMALTDETEFVKIMQYRGTNVSKIKNKEEKARIKRLQEHYALKFQKMQKFADAASRNTAFRDRLKSRYAEVQKQALRKE